MNANLTPSVARACCRAVVPHFGCRLFVDRAREFAAFELAGARIVADRATIYTQDTATADVLLWAPDAAALRRGVSRLRRVFHPDRYTFGEPWEERFGSLSAELAALEAREGGVAHPLTTEPAAWLSGAPARARVQALRAHLSTVAPVAEGPR